MDTIGLIGMMSTMAAGLCIGIGAIGSAIGEGMAAAAALRSIAQQPDQTATLTRTLFVAMAMIEHYNLKPGDRILDIGCGKGFLIYDFLTILPEVKVVGLDLSKYAILNAKEEIKPFLHEGHARQLPYDDNSFDLVISINTLHNLYSFELFDALIFHSLGCFPFCSNDIVPSGDRCQRMMIGRSGKSLDDPMRA